jgi:ubiquinone/menaquinone biosynthesis C-methylase UbiE
LRRCRVAASGDKGEAELAYWRGRKQEEQRLANTHYRRFYTEHFGLADADYDGKRVLDIGCGPRGSLEWADMALERVGLDPLAEQYLEELGADDHAMSYFATGSETIPFSDGHFDIVCSFNSLDHVDDLDQTISEIGRVVAPGGYFLLIAEVNNEPTVCEPSTFSWDIVDRFVPPLRVERVRQFEELESAGLYGSIDRAVEYDHADDTDRLGILSAKFAKG